MTLPISTISFGSYSLSAVYLVNPDAWYEVLASMHKVAESQKVVGQHDVIGPRLQTRQTVAWRIWAVQDGARSSSRVVRSIE